MLKLSRIESEDVFENSPPRLNLKFSKYLDYTSKLKQYRKDLNRGYLKNGRLLRLTLLTLWINLIPDGSGEKKLHTF